MAESVAPNGLPAPEEEESGTDTEYRIAPAPDPDEQPADEEQRGTPATTAFIIIVKTDGGAVATNDLGAMNDLILERPASLEDMHRALLEVEKDITLARTAQETVHMIQAQAQAMAEAQQQAAIQAQLAQESMRQGRGGVPVGGRRR